MGSTLSRFLERSKRCALRRWSASHRSLDLGKRRRRHSVRLVAALVVLLGPALMLVASPSQALATAPGRGAAAETSAPALAQGGAASAEHDYAAREARAKPLQSFQGGDTTIVVGGSLLVIVLVVVLVVVLI